MSSGSIDAGMWGWCAQSDEGSECILKKLAGMQCNASNECNWVATPLRCIDGICQCQAGYRMNNEALCVPATLNIGLDIEHVLLGSAVVALIVASLTLLYSVKSVYPKKSTIEYLQDTPRLSFHDRYQTAQFKQFNEEMDEVLSTSLRDSDQKQRRRIEKRRRIREPKDRNGVFGDQDRRTRSESSR